MRREVPEPWASAMLERGFVYAKRPSLRALARAAGIPSVETVRKLVHGESSPEVETVSAVANALGVSAALVGTWVGQTRSIEKPFDVPPEVVLLTSEEQLAIQDLIRAIAKPRRQLRQLATGSGKTDALLSAIDQLPADDRFRVITVLTDRTERVAPEDDPDDEGLAEAAYTSPELAGRVEPEQP